MTNQNSGYSAKVPFVGRFRNIFSTGIWFRLEPEATMFGVSELVIPSWPALITEPLSPTQYRTTGTAGAAGSAWSTIRLNFAIEVSTDSSKKTETQFHF